MDYDLKITNIETIYSIIVEPEYTNEYLKKSILNRENNFFKKLNKMKREYEMDDCKNWYYSNRNNINLIFKNIIEIYDDNDIVFNDSKKKIYNDFIYFLYKKQR